MYVPSAAPMMRFGVLDVSTIPDGFYYYAASGDHFLLVKPKLKKCV